MRLDKFLKETGFGSRTEVKKIIKSKVVYVNDNLILKEDYPVNEEIDKVVVDGEVIKYVKYVYIMLNKPQGVVSATSDKEYYTVIDLINDYRYLDLFPVGRLDIDTTGLLLITNDGQLAHDLLSPKHHVDKTYLVKTLNPLTNEEIKTLEKGILIDNELTLPSTIEEVDSCLYKFTIHEGKYHQIKRMVEYCFNKVISLKRISFGPLTLDPSLKEGMYRLLTNEEIEKIK